MPVTGIRIIHPWRDFATIAVPQVATASSIATKPPKRACDYTTFWLTVSVCYHFWWPTIQTKMHNNWKSHCANGL